MPVTRIYTRASTDKQALSPARQAARCAEYHKAMGTLPPLLAAGAYRDPATSGSTDFNNREAGHALLLDCQFKDHLIVDAFDRIGRDIPDILNTVRLLHKRGVVLHILNLLILSLLDPDDPMAETMLAQYASFAQLERKMISIRTKRGLQSKRMEGHSTGNGRPLGYKAILNPDFDPVTAAARRDSYKVPRRLVVPDPADKDYFDQAVLRYYAGEKITAIQRYLRNHPGASGFNYWRLHHHLTLHKEKMREEEMRVERQRTFGRHSEGVTT